MITIWLLMILLAVSMSLPAASFAAEKSNTNGEKADKAKVTKQAESKKDKKKDKDEKKDKKKDKKKKDKKKKKKKKKKKDKDKKKKKKDKDKKKKKDKDKKKKKKRVNCYRVKKKDGVMKCRWYDEDGKKSDDPEKDAYFFVTFDKGSKTKGTAVKKAGEKGILYHFNKKGKGKKYTGWFEQGSKKYYFKKGKRYRGMKKIKKTWYHFSDENGRLWYKIGDGMDKKAQSYSSHTKYLVVVNLKKHQTRIYEGSKNDWKRIYKWKCVIGKPSTPTPKGTFYVGTRGLHFDTGKNMRVWYYTQFYGSYFFHSVLYDRKSEPVNCVSYRLGKSLSHGCIRLKLKNARWIYRHISSGTKVVIY